MIVLNIYPTYANDIIVPNNHIYQALTDIKQIYYENNGCEIFCDLHKPYRAKFDIHYG